MLTQEQDISRRNWVPPRWVPISSSVLCVIILIDSAYLTWAHFTSPRILACVTTGIFNCGAVTTSSYSHPFGVPVVLPGLAWSIAMLALCSPRGWRSLSLWPGRLRLAGCVAGLGMVFWLVYVELFKLDRVCEYCTVIHIMTVALFVVVVLGTALATPAGLDEPDPDGSL